MLLMTNEEEDTEPVAEAIQEDALKIGDISILNSLPGFVKRMKLPLTGAKPFKVHIGSGKTILFESLCSRVTLDIQGLQMDVDLYMLPMKGPDIVLGIQWLQKLGKVTYDYSNQTMEFSWSGRDYALKGEESLRLKQISLRHMRYLLETEEVYGVYELYLLATKVDISDKTAVKVETHLAISQLIARFDSLFQVPIALPPHHNIDHRAMEKLMNEMMSQGIIRDHQFYVKQSKCVFEASSLDYLGHIISRKGVDMDSKKVAAVREWHVPTSHRQVHGFEGLVGYYRCFIKEYATIAAPLSSLLQKQGFRWGESKHKAFKDLKRRMSGAPIWGLPNFEEMFVVEADVSDVGITWF
ncbi:retrotransposon-related protein [Tanacetum coccineum]